MLDLHGNLIKLGDFVKNRCGLIGKVIERESYLSVEYPDDHVFYLSDDYAANLEIVKVNHWACLEE